MERYAAFLRGINVGGHRVKMERLRSILREAGLEEVATLLASGNVIFNSDVPRPKLVELIQTTLHDALGYEVATFLRTVRELAPVVDLIVPAELGRPTDFESHYVTFFEQPVPISLRQAVHDLETESDRFLFRAAEMHWLINGKLSESPLFGRGLDRALGDTPHTMRSINTVQRVAAKLSA